MGREIVFTAGEVVQFDGTRLPALIEVIECRPVGVSGFVTAREAWSVRELGQPPRWECIVEDWLPENERQPSVSFSNTNVFPLAVRFRLPHQAGQEPRRFRIEPTGASVDLSEGGGR